MSKEIESISTALFDKIRSRFPNVTLGDEKAKAATDPSKARFFNFTYSAKDGAEFGTVTISLIDETSLKVYFGQNISGEMDRDQRNEWYEFLRNLRNFAKRNLLTFDTRDINKSNLELKDVKQQAKADDTFTTSDIRVTESKLYGTPGRPYNSFSDQGKTKILIRHADKVNDEVRGSRARRIQEIFLETERGERFLLPHTNLHGARAMAEHLNNGGTIYDEFAEHIDSMVAEMSAMRHFVRSTKHRQFEDQETSDMTQAAIRHYDQLKKSLRHLSSKRYYDEYKETYQPQGPVEDEIDVDALRERFVKKVYDDRFNDALPIVARAYNNQQKQAHNNIGNELAEWADEVTESTWTTPNTPDKAEALIELLKTPLRAGIDGIDAIADLKDLIGDDELNDQIGDLASGQGPDADVTPLIKTWLQQKMPQLYSQVETALKQTGRDAQTNFPAPVSPQPAQSSEYGTTPAHPNVSNMTMEETDPLEFIRSLAGIRK